MSQSIFFCGTKEQLDALVKANVREVVIERCRILSSPACINIDKSKLLTKKQVAIYCNIPRTKVSLYASQGKLLPAKIGGKLRFFKSDVLRFLESKL